jgi:hypothetical protein
MPGSKNVLKKLDYDKLQIQVVNHLPLCFDDTQLFVFPTAEVSSSQTRAKSLDGMDKQYDGHVWTKTQTTNISNDVALAFRSSACISHLQCHLQNPSCDYLQHPHRTSKVNDTEFEGFTKDPFPLSGIVPSGSTIVCRICKQPPKCIALCDAKIFNVYGKESSQIACIHIGTHQHPVKVGDYRDSRKRINALLEEHVDCSPQATYNKIILEANKDIVGDFFLSGNNDTQRLHSLKDLKPVFKRCRELNFQSEDKDAQVLFWQNLNHVMARHGIPHPNFIGFMADSAQANWNVIHIVYGSEDPKVSMEGRERTCFFIGNNRSRNIQNRM